MTGVTSNSLADGVSASPRRPWLQFLPSRELVPSTPSSVFRSISLLPWACIPQSPHWLTWLRALLPETISAPFLQLMTCLVSSGDLGFLECHLETELGTPDEVGVFLNVSIYIFELIASNCTEDGRRDLETKILRKMALLNSYLCRIPGRGREGGKTMEASFLTLAGPRLDLSFPNSCFHFFPFALPSLPSLFYLRVKPRDFKS